MNIAPTEHAQALALLEWYGAMGVDEVLAETAQNWLAPPVQAVPLAPTAAEAIAFRPAIAPPTVMAEAPAAELLSQAQTLAKQAGSLADLKAAIAAFDQLGICKTATQAVFAEGAEDAPLMVIGEAPGADEDKRGLPFCGASGQLLDKILTAIGHSRQENTFITNSVYWRPPGNRTPSSEEIEICRPFVRRAIELLAPKAILLVGGVAVRSVLDIASPLGKLRGKWHEKDGLPPMRVAYHPAYLLRQPKQKKLAWDDVLAVKRQLRT